MLEEHGTFVVFDITMNYPGKAVSMQYSYTNPMYGMLTKLCILFKMGDDCLPNHNQHLMIDLAQFEQSTC